MATESTIKIPGIKAQDYSDDDGEWAVSPISSPTNGAGFEIDMTQEYDRPTASMALLLLLAEHFGTHRIDIDEVSERGCESCDWGSRYGYTVQVYGATKNVPTFE